MWKTKIFTFRYAIIVVLAILTTTARSQEMLGVISGNYAGVNSTLINPSLIHNSKLYLDVNLLTADVFHQNNYLYIARDEYKFINFFKNDYTYPTHPLDNGSGDRPLYTNDNTSNKHSYSQLRVIGPSAMLQVNDHAFAIQMGTRVTNVVKDLPYDMANYFYYGLGYLPQRQIRYSNEEEFISTTMTWSEIAFTYALILKKFYKNKWTAGVTVKGLIGHGGSYINGYYADYTVLDGSTIDIHRLDMDMGYALPVDYNTNEFLPGGLMKGSGVGFDLGVTYQRNKRGHSNMKYRKLCQQQFDAYDYRIGFSLLDFGSVKFTDNAQLYQFADGQALWENVDSLFRTYDNLNEISEALSDKFCGDPGCAMTAREFSIALPAAVSVQFDYHYRNAIYLNATWVQPVRLGKAYIYRPSVLAITPRYETGALGFMLPVSLYDYRNPRIGAAVRFYNFTVGTDKILGFFNLTNFTGLDLYVSVKLFIPKGNCTRSRKKNRYCNDTPYRMNKN